MTISKMVRKRSVGKSGEMLSLLSSMKLLIDTNPVSVSMLVFIDLASAEKRRAFSGICRLLSSLVTVMEFL